MTDSGLLLRAYYEQLHRRLERRREDLTTRVEQHLARELSRHFSDFRPDKFKAYREACLAFVEERLEAYNPIGIQYTFDLPRSKTAAALELELDWFDSRNEFAALRTAAQRKAFSGMEASQLDFLADELILEHGAFPNQSIIAGYQNEPSLNKLPDYIVAMSIEQVLGVT
jgi:hypothetical protein